MNSSIKILLLAAVVVICSNACDKDVRPAQPVIQKGKITGRITNSRGQAIHGATIIQEHTVWFNSFVSTNSDVTGNYEADIPTSPSGSWSAKATLTKSAFGQNYKFDLHPDASGSFNANNNVVRNFQWNLTGERPNGGQYGAHVDVYAIGNGIPLTQVKLVFTPFPGETTLIDGSAITGFERELEEVAGTFMVRDIPIGKYMVKAVAPGRTLLLDYKHDNGDPQLNKPVIFGKYGFLADTEYNLAFWLSE